MSNDINKLINLVSNGTSCRGLEGKEIATTLIRNCFERENIDFDGWEVTEIPWVNQGDGVDASVCVIVYHSEMDITLDIALDFDAKLIELELCVENKPSIPVTLSTIMDAFKYYKNSCEYCTQPTCDICSRLGHTSCSGCQNMSKFTADCYCKMCGRNLKDLANAR